MKPGMDLESISGLHFGALRDPAIEMDFVGIIASQPVNFAGRWLASSNLARSYARLSGQQD